MTASSSHAQPPTLPIGNGVDVVHLPDRLDLLSTAALLTVPRTRRWGPRTRALLAAFGAAGLADTLITDHPAELLRRVPLPVHLDLEASGGPQLLTAAAT